MSGRDAEAKLEFKCRRCGVVERGPCTTPQVAFRSLVELTSGRQASAPGIPVGLMDLHFCRDGGLGISDLIGADRAPAGRP